MSTVYQHQLHAHKVRKNRWRWWLAGVVVLVIGVGVVLHKLKPDTTISNPKATVTTVKGESDTQSFHKGQFTIQLPRGWQFTSVQHDVYTIYHFRSALPGEQGNRMIDVYEDSSLPNFAINRMLPVEATEQGGLIANSSEVSDNCTAYTTGKTAKWQGIEFNCDMVNPLRNVVGIGSMDGVNTVKITSLSTGVHHYFMTYTENNNKPNYNIFVAALNSFKVDQ